MISSLQRSFGQSTSQAEAVQTQSVAAPDPPYHAQLVKPLIAVGSASADEPLLHGAAAGAARTGAAAACPFPEAAVRGAVGAAAVPGRGAGDGEAR